MLIIKYNMAGLAYKLVMKVVTSILQKATPQPHTPHHVFSMPSLIMYFAMNVINKLICRHDIELPVEVYCMELFKFTLGYIFYSI